MKIKIEAATIVFRVSADEACQLQKGQTIENLLPMTPSIKMRYSIKAVDRHLPLFLSIQPDHWAMEIAPEALDRYLAGSAKREGLRTQQPVVPGSTQQFLEIVFQVDIKKTKTP